MALTGIPDTSITTPGTISGTKSIKTVEAGNWVFYTFNAMKAWFLSTFTNIADVPNSYTGHGNKKLRVKSSVDGLEFVADDFKSLIDVPNSYTGHGGKILAVKSDVSGLEFVTPSGGAGSGFTTYSPLAGVLVTGTAGILASKTSGTITITIPTGGHLDSGEVEFIADDCDYANSLVSDGLKLKIVAQGVSVKRVFPPIIMSRTSSGGVSGSNPLQYSSAINLSLQSDEYASNVSSWCWNQVGGNAPAGGFIQF